MTKESAQGLILKILYVQGGDGMRIKSIFVKKYKNIREQTLTFPNDSSYVALIGLNNSGKSNWLEAVSLIFRDMYTGEKAGFTYKVNYDVDGRKYELTSRSLKVDGKTINKKISAAPSNVIACYSGESLRLWRLAYEEYYMNFFAGAAKNEFSNPQMMYLNKYSWAICLIVLMCSDDSAVKTYLRNHLGVEDLLQVDVAFDFNEQNIDKLKDNEVKSFLSRIYTKGQATSTISMATIASYDIGVSDNKEKCRRLFYLLFLAAMPKCNDRIQFDKSIAKIRISLDGRELDDISEGEKKLVLITCIARVLADKNSLLLLDEPDAHVHVANKMNMGDLFKIFDGQIILTTHSPLFTDKLGSGNLLFISDGKVENVPERKRVSTLSDGYITFVDGAFLMTSKNVVVTEGHYDIAYIKRAIELLKVDTPKYSRLDQLCFVSQGGAGNAKDFYKDTICPIIDSLNKVLFLFDNDSDGRKGASVINKLKESKVSSLLYSGDFGSKADEFFLEDYFPQQCYDSEVMKVIREIGSAKSYRDIKKIAFSLSTNIKSNLQCCYSKLEINAYQKFRPLLDKMMEEFGMSKD